MPGETDGLGFEISQDTNLFELFNKNQGDDGSLKAVPLDTVITDDSSTKTAPEKKDPPINVPDDKPGEDSKAKVDPEAAKRKEENDAELKRLLEEKQKGGGGDGDDKGDASKQKPEGDDADNPIAIVFEDFKENGIIEVPEDFKFDGTAKGLREAVEATVEARLENAVVAEIDGAFEKNPANADLAKRFFRYLGLGGNPADFVETVRSEGIDIKQLDAEDEAVKSATARRVLTNYYQSLNWDPARIKRTIERNEAKGVDFLVDEAKDVYPEWDKVNKEKLKRSEEALKTQAQAKQDQIATFNQTLTEAIDTATEIAGFEMSPKAKQALKDYMFKPTVELNGKMVPQFIADRSQKQNTPEYILSQALQLKNGLKPNTKAVETKLVDKLEESLKGMNKGKKISQTGTGTDTKAEKGPGIFDFEHDGAVIM